MIISNLTYTEFASEANNIEGGNANAGANALALAAGPNFANTLTGTATAAAVVPGIFPFIPGVSNAASASASASNAG